MKSKRPASFSNVPLSRVRANACAPSLRASASLAAEVLSIVTSAPSDAASFTPMCPSPPSPTTPTRSPAFTFHCRSGDQVVMPAHKSGAAAAGSSPAGMRSVKRSDTTSSVA